MLLMIFVFINIYLVIDIDALQSVRLETNVKRTHQLYFFFQMWIFAACLKCLTYTTIFRPIFYNSLLKNSS